MHAVSIRDARKSFGPQTVLDDLSLDIEAGEFVVLLGPSGCGKSTLLNVVAGLEELDSGSIRIAGRVVTDLEPDERGVAMVFQSYALYPTMTVEGNLSFGLRMAGENAAAIKAQVSAVADLLQIHPLLKRKPAQLSGGQRQRVAIGRALIRNAPLYLFDEPLSNLDAQLRVEMRMELKRLHARLRATILYVTHDQVEAMTLATRLAVLSHGRVEQYGPPRAIYDRPATAFVAAFVGSPAMNLWPARLRCDAGRKWAELSGGCIDLDDYPFQHDAIDGRRIIVGLRPEHIRPRASDSVRGTCLDLEVESTEPFGATSLLWCRFGADRLAAWLDPPADIAAGRRVALNLDCHKLAVFCAQSDLRL